MPIPGFKRRKETQEKNNHEKPVEKIIEGNNDVETCAKHPQKSLDMFCVECEQLYCTVCLQTVHKRNKRHKFKYISEAADDFADSEKFTYFNEKISKLEEKLDRSMYRIKENIKLSEQLKQDADNTIKQTRDNFIQLIEKHCNDILQQTENKNNSTMSRLKKLAIQNVELKKEVIQTGKEINEKKDMSDLCPMFIAVIKSKPKVKRIEDEIQKLSDSNSVTRYMFEAGEQALTFMKNKEDFGDLVEENLDSLELNSSYDTDESVDTFEDDVNSAISRHAAHPMYLSSPISTRRYDTWRSEDTKEFTRTANFQSSPREEFQRSFSMRILPSSSRPLGDFTEYWKRIPANEMPKRLSRPQSVPSIPISGELTGLQEDGGYLKPKNSKKGVAMMDHGQFSNSKESLNSASTSSGARPKRPPKPGPKPSAQVIKQAREKNNTSYGYQLDNFDWQTQNMKEKRKVVYSYTPDNADDLRFEEGDLVTVQQKCSDGWCAVELNGQYGYIPKDYLEGTVLHASIRSKLENMFRP